MQVLISLLLSCGVLSVLGGRLPINGNAAGPTCSLNGDRLFKDSRKLLYMKEINIRRWSILRSIEHNDKSEQPPLISKGWNKYPSWLEGEWHFSNYSIHGNVGWMLVPQQKFILDSVASNLDTIHLSTNGELFLSATSKNAAVEVNRNEESIQATHSSIIDVNYSNHLTQRHNAISVPQDILKPIKWEFTPATRRLILCFYSPILEKILRFSLRLKWNAHEFIIGEGNCRLQSPAAKPTLLEKNSSLYSNLFAPLEFLSPSKETTSMPSSTLFSEDSLTSLIPNDSLRNEKDYIIPGNVYSKIQAGRRCREEGNFDCPVIWNVQMHKKIARGKPKKKCHSLRSARHGYLKLKIEDKFSLLQYAREWLVGYNKESLMRIFNANKQKKKSTVSALLQVYSLYVDGRPVGWVPAVSHFVNTTHLTEFLSPQHQLLQSFFESARWIITRNSTLSSSNLETSLVCVYDTKLIKFKIAELETVFFQAAENQQLYTSRTDFNTTKSPSDISRINELEHSSLFKAFAYALMHRTLLKYIAGVSSALPIMNRTIHTIYFIPRSRVLNFVSKHPRKIIKTA